MRLHIMLQACLALTAALAAAQQEDCPPLVDLVAGLNSSLLADALATQEDAAAAAPAPAAPQRRRLAEAQGAASAAPATFRACPRIAAWVCGTDGLSWANDCVAAEQGVGVACEGRCPCPSGNDAAAAAGVVAAGPVDPLMGPCPKIEVPVCGVDGRTYSNLCTAGGLARVACDGHCPCRRIAQQVQALPAEPQPGGVAAPGGGGPVATTGGIDSPGATPGATPGGMGQPVACPAIFAPVCGTNNESYSNDCVAGAAGATVACSGDCPCQAPVCSNVVEPVCGADAVNYTNVCYAQLARQQVACLGTCPCPDLLAALQDAGGGGGILLLPTDEALMAAMEAADGGDWLNSTAVLQGLLARHTVLAANQKNGTDLNLTAAGTSVVTEAGEPLMLYAAAGAVPGRVQTVGVSFNAFTVTGTAGQAGCNLTVVQFDGVLAGPALLPALQGGGGGAGIQQGPVGLQQGPP